MHNLLYGRLMVGISSALVVGALAVGIIIQGQLAFPPGPSKQITGIIVHEVLAYPPGPTKQIASIIIDEVSAYPPGPSSPVA